MIIKLTDGKNFFDEKIIHSFSELVELNKKLAETLNQNLYWTLELTPTLEH